MSAYLAYVTVPGDRWDLIAHAHYGDVERAAELIAANRDGFTDDPALFVPAVLPAGLTLRIPIIARETADPRRLPPWKR